MAQPYLDKNVKCVRMDLRFALKKRKLEIGFLKAIPHN